MNNNENNQNVNANEQPVAAPVENNEKKSWFGTAWNVIKGTPGAVANAFKEHKVAAIGLTAAAVAVTVTAVILKKKGSNTAEPADPEGFDNK